MEQYQNIEARQIWTDPGHASPHCEGFRIPAGGLLIVNETLELALAEPAVYQPACTIAASYPASTTAVDNSSLPLYGSGDPFSGSVVPQMFVLGAMLVIAWSLVVILVITPRTSFVLGTGTGYLGRSNGNSATVISIGGRPWLQKVAAFLVGVSLIIAAVNSFKIIEQQYEDGYQDAATVNKEVINSYEVRIIRVISTTVVWLAQVQTLIRLFPRHREKVIIKWAGFGLIVLDTLFVILDNFVSHEGNGPKTSQPRGHTEPISALSYLFELALNLLYAAWVVYYSFVKRRYAFFHPQMRNIAVVALLSYFSVLIPVVFFITDIAQPQVAAWGDYIRWVGSAAASVVVWEWVERIEALEREERKNGILGREIFDGDEVFRKSASIKFPQWPRKPPQKPGDSSGTSTGIEQSTKSDSTESQRTQLGDTNRDVQLADIRRPEPTTKATAQTSRRRSLLPGFRLPAAESPVSRADTASAASTVYAVVHHPPSTSTTPAPEAPLNTARPVISRTQQPTETETDTGPVIQQPVPVLPQRQLPPQIAHFLPTIGNPFKRRRSSPPPEVSRAAVDAAGRPSQARMSNRRKPKNIFRLGRPQVLPADLPIVVVPAQPRGQIWTPPADVENTNPLDRVTQDPRSGENMAGHTPLSLDGSVYDQQNNNAIASHHPNSASPNNRIGEYLSAGSPSLERASDRAHSPRLMLPRVDEQIEHTEVQTAPIVDPNSIPLSGPPAD